MRVAVAGLCALGLAACDDQKSPTLVYEAHGIHIEITEAPARIEVTRVSDGEIIFDGVPGGFETREASPQIEWQVGSFKFDDDTKTPWVEGGTFRNVAIDGDVIHGAIEGGGGKLGTFTITTGEVAGAKDGAGAQVEISVDFSAGGAVNRAALSYQCTDGEHFLGLGGQAWDVDHRGHTVPLWVEEDGVTKSDNDDYEGAWFLTGRRHSTHLPVPIFLSTRGYQAAVDTDARSIFSFCDPDRDESVVRLETWQPVLDLHLFVGEPDPGDDRAANLRAIDMMTSWVGRPDAPAPVIFAPWLDALYGDDNVRRVAQKLRDNDVAVSVIWTEDVRGAEDSVEGYQLLENWHLDRSLYPDFEGTAANLHDRGYQWLTYANTFLESRADIYDEALANGYEVHHTDGTPYVFEGNTFKPESMLDLSNPDARAWMMGILREWLALGADGWMADFGEWLPFDAKLYDGRDPMLAHNHYTVEWAKANHDLQVERGGNLTFFMRSAYLHSQPYVQVVWPGDNQTDWTLGDGFPSVIPSGIGLGIAGFPYYAHDIGGYMSALTVPTTKELWWRWCELGALTPVMRTHHGRSAAENWNWESDAETTAHLSRYSKLHMQLVPYLEARAVDAQETGVPVLRPIGLEYPSATWDWVWAGTDEYMLGDRILVAPVLQEGATTRDVQLPDGTWYPLLGGAPVAGPGDTVDAPIGEIPAFVAEGSILVMYPDTVDTVLDAPGDNQTVTTADVGGDRDVVLFPGTPARAQQSHEVEAGGGAYSWSGRDASAAAPTTATFEGNPVTVTPVAGGVQVTVNGPGELAFEGGGTLSVQGPVGTLTVTLRSGS